MTTVSNVTSTATGTQTAAAAAASTLDKDDFLQLLITKMQHQDPLDPVEDEDFVAQLAQFSTLEQMNNIAEGIAASNELDLLQMQSINNTMASGLIGRDVVATFEGVYVEDGKATKINFTLGQRATHVTFEIKDSSGTVVRRLTATDLAAGIQSVDWDGRNSDGNQVEDGYYTVEGTATGLSGASFEPKLQVVGTIESISYRDGAAYLLVNGAEISLGDVAAVGPAGAFEEE
jgi:flagellar basal-body rod modification protein FlgD